jgi:hypothetical protein
LSDLVVTSEVDRVLEPLGENNLQTALTIDLDLAQEVNNVAGAGEGKAGKDEDKRLDKCRSFGCSKSVGNSLEELRQEWSQALLASLLDQLGSQATNFGSRVILDRRTKQSVNDMQADFEARTAIAILPVENLLMIVLQGPLDSLTTRSKNLAFRGLHQKAVQLGERSSDEARGEGLRSMLGQDSQQLDSDLQVISFNISRCGGYVLP